MMELKIYPDSVLRRRALPLKRITEVEAQRLDSMLDIMYASHGVGLAGPQVGWNARVLTMDTQGRSEGERVFINPNIVESDGLLEDEEGCLSLPDIRCRVVRAERVVVVTFNLRGERLELEAEGLEARAWQHEIDHLNGVLFIDKISPGDRLAIRGRLNDLERRRGQPT